MQVKKHGGKREGAGRKKAYEGKSVKINVAISEESYEIYRTLENKSRVVDELIKTLKSD